ncbi:MAG: histidine kinase, partial [Lachnospiraceae bacterium]|nr:histidine kinase [Lachnospiraceae bacterium]
EDEEIQSICIYCDEETDILNELGNQFTDVDFFVPLSEIEYTYWKTILDITGETSGLFPGFYLSEQERSVYGGTAYVQQVQYSKLGEWKTAYVVVYCEESNIVGILQEYGTLEGELAYVIDSRNVIVTPYEEDFVLYIEDYETLEETFPEAKTFYTGSYGGEAVYVCRYEVDSLDWALVWVIPESAIAGESRTLLVSALGTYSLLLILGIAAAWGISWTILGRIYRLKDHMQNVKTGHPAVLEGETGTDEIGELISTYNYMVNQVNESMTREMQAQEEMSEMRLEILRAQIDPHFLYNTLDLLRGLSQKGEKQKVEELVLALTQFYRLALNRGEKFSTVEREILQSESYMKIMNMRFGDQLNFVVDVADEILEYYVPVLIFQPILENAIIHGILEKEIPSGNISLTGWREGDDLVFLISDDGVGIDEETMKAIMEGRKTSGRAATLARIIPREGFS